MSGTAQVYGSGGRLEGPKRRAALPHGAVCNRTSSETRDGLGSQEIIIDRSPALSGSARRRRALHTRWRRLRPNAGSIRRACRHLRHGMVARERSSRRCCGRASMGHRGAASRITTPRPSSMKALVVALRLDRRLPARRAGAGMAGMIDQGLAEDEGEARVGLIKPTFFGSLSRLVATT